MLLQAVSMPDSALQTARSTADSDEAFSDLASSDDDFNEPYNARKNLYAPPVLLVSVECDSRLGTPAAAAAATGWALWATSGRRSGCRRSGRLLDG